jgi:hypothetical protein
MICCKLMKLKKISGYLAKAEKDWKAYPILFLCQSLAPPDHLVPSNSSSDLSNLSVLHGYPPDAQPYLTQHVVTKHYVFNFY